MGKTVPILIGFLASLLGIGGLADKVLGVIRKIRHGYRYGDHSNPSHSRRYQMDYGLADSGWCFFKAAMAIIDVVKFFIQRAAQIIELIKAFTDSVAAIASGKVGAVAKSKN